MSELPMVRQSILDILEVKSSWFQLVDRDLGDNKTYPFKEWNLVSELPMVRQSILDILETKSSWFQLVDRDLDFRWQ